MLHSQVEFLLLIFLSNYQAHKPRQKPRGEAEKKTTTHTPGICTNEFFNCLNKSNESDMNVSCFVVGGKLTHKKLTEYSGLTLICWMKLIDQMELRCNYVV